MVDAGIAALLCLGVVHPHTAGLGQYCVLFITSPSFTNQIFQGHSLGWSEQKVVETSSLESESRQRAEKA